MEDFFCHWSTLTIAIKENSIHKLGMVAYTYNPNVWKAETGEGCYFDASLDCLAPSRLAQFTIVKVFQNKPHTAPKKETNKILFTNRNLYV